MPPSCALFGGFAIGALATLWKCVAEPSSNVPGLPHTPHRHTTHAGEDSPRMAGLTRLSAPCRRRGVVVAIVAVWM